MAGDRTYIYDPSKDTGKVSEDSISKKLNGYLLGDKESAEALLSLYDRHGVNLFAYLEQDLPEMRGKWIKYVFEKHCSGIPDELRVGLQNNCSLFDRLMEDKEWTAVFPQFKERVLKFRKVIKKAQLKELEEAGEETVEEKKARLKKELEELESN